MQREFSECKKLRLLNSPGFPNLLNSAHTKRTKRAEGKKRLFGIHTGDGLTYVFIIFHLVKSRADSFGASEKYGRNSFCRKKLLINLTLQTCSGTEKFYGSCNVSLPFKILLWKISLFQLSLRTRNGLYEQFLVETTNLMIKPRDWLVHLDMQTHKDKCIGG